MSERGQFVQNRLVLELLSWCKCDLLRSLRMTWLHTVSRQLPAGYPVTRVSTLLSFPKIQNYENENFSVLFSRHYYWPSLEVSAHVRS